MCARLVHPATREAPSGHGEEIAYCLAAIRPDDTSSRVSRVVRCKEDRHAADVFAGARHGPSASRFGVLRGLRAPPQKREATCGTP